MSDKKTTVTIRDNQPVAVSSSLNGANLDTACFNMTYIFKHDPKLAEEIMEIFDKAKETK